jgi:signal transduction histidine kinase
VHTGDRYTCPQGRPGAPYRTLFHHLPFGAAHCRLVAEGEQAVRVEILDSNRAFEPHPTTLRQPVDMLSRVRDARAAETLQLRTEIALLSMSALPAGDDEVMVMIEDVTAREQLVQRARESQNRFEPAFHGNAAAMVIAQQSDLRIVVDVNPRWLEMFRVVRAEVIGHTSVELGLIMEARARTRITLRDRPHRVRRHVDLDPLVHAVVDELLVGRRLGDRLELRLMPLGSCNADPSLLLPIWTNLIDNALKYSRDRDHVVISIGREIRGGEVVYYVRDNAVGFDMAHAGRLFGVFQRLHTASEFEAPGSGSPTSVGSSSATMAASPHPRSQIVAAHSSSRWEQR